MGCGLRWGSFCVVTMAFVGWGCAVEQEAHEAPVDPQVKNGEQAALTGDALLARASQVRDAAVAKGLTTPVLVAAVGLHESGLAQCWSEATWTCQGPWSSDCGGPVIAGAFDGACEAQQGGLGMFQLDSGTYAQTLAQHGETVLSVAGNTQAGVDFIVHKVRICPNTPQFSSDAEVVEWLNRATPGSSEFEAFFTAMAWCYNGCAPTFRGCSHTAVRDAYRNAAFHLLDLYGETFWTGEGAAPPPPPPEEEQPAEDPCGGVTYQGTCEAGVITWCEGGTVRSRDCPAQGQGCGWQNDDVGFVCTNGCGTLDYAGGCAGDSLRWCEGGALRTAACANGCGFESDAVGFNCL